MSLLLREVAALSKTPISLFPYFGVTALLATAAYAFMCAEDGAFYAWLLLCLSLFFEFIILRVSDSDAKTLAGRLVKMEMAKVAGVWIYWLFARSKVTPALQVLGHLTAIAAFCCAFLVVFWTFRLTRDALAAEPSATRDKQAIEADLCAVLLAFLHVTYFMTFSLAIEDKSTGGHSLHATSAFVPSHSAERVQTTPPAEAKVQGPCANASLDRIRRFYFNLGSSDLSYMKALEEKTDHDTLEKEICGREQGGREAYLWTLTKKNPEIATAKERDSIRAAAWNLREKFELQSLLKQLDHRHEYRAQLQGHATDDPPVDARFPNNDQRSMTRTLQVQAMLLDLAIREGVRPPTWETTPVGNDSSFLETDETRLHEVNLDRKLCVEVWLRAIPLPESADLNDPPGALTLLDYTYFMIYTITSTGYGDLVPSSPATRSLTSMANLFELFFLIIVVNLVMALRGSPKPAATPAVSS